jgi:hypothetical protein
MRKIARMGLGASRARDDELLGSKGPGSQLRQAAHDHARQFARNLLKAMRK